MRLGLALAVAVLGSACINMQRATGPLFSPVKPLPADEAIVYVFRGRGDHIGYPVVYVNGARQFRLLLDSYGILRLPPGNHVILVKGSFWTDWTQADVSREIQVAGGREYYVAVWRRAEEVSTDGPAHVPGKKVAVARVGLVPDGRAIGHIMHMRLVTSGD